MKELVLLVGPPGSGKSTLAKDYEARMYRRVSQDDQGKQGHMDEFTNAIMANRDIVIDRMGFDLVQRNRYLDPAKAAGYRTKIIVLHESSATCLERMLKREGHPTIKDEKNARSALHTFMSKYQRVQDSEADVVERVWPQGEKPSCIPVDLDGTLCDIEHRLHFVRGEGKKNWKDFMYNIPYDSVNEWCRSLIDGMTKAGHQIIYCSGRGGENRGDTKQWLMNNHLFHYCADNNHDFTKGKELVTHLYMRERNDHRTDFIVKEIILDFEVLTRFTPLFMVDDRLQVVEMYRSRGFTVLQCAKGDF